MRSEHTWSWATSREASMSSSSMARAASRLLDTDQPTPLLALPQKTAVQSSTFNSRWQGGSAADFEHLRLVFAHQPRPRGRPALPPWLLAGDTGGPSRRGTFEKPLARSAERKLASTLSRQASRRCAYVVSFRLGRIGQGALMSDKSPRCPVCASDDVAIRGSAGAAPSPFISWECRVCRTLFAYGPGR
jgi:hypothetical protein